VLQDRFGARDDCEAMEAAVRRCAEY
jgi:hypothetical protein